MKKMRLVCPTCGAHLIHRWVKDESKSHEIYEDEDGEVQVKTLADKSDGHNEVVCGKNVKHAIPEELVVSVLDLVTM